MHTFCETIQINFTSTTMINKHSAKVTPVKPTIKQNNFFNNGGYIVKKFKLLITVQAILGVGRLYLLEPRKIFIWTNYLYSIAIAVVLSYSLFQNNYFGATYVVFKCTAWVEYFILVLTAMFLQRKALRECFKNLETFDSYLNIQKDIDVLIPLNRIIIWMASSVVFSVAEYIVILNSRLDYALTNCTIVVHDFEQLFFCALLRAILLRVRIVKAHVVRVCSNPRETRKPESLDKIEALSNNVTLDISSLHEVYESLHKCSEQLNFVMSFPMMTMLLSSGLSTIILLKYAFTIFQLNEESNDRALLIYIFIRCVKYTALMVIPCYYSSTTTTQVTIIRKTLHDALNNSNFDKIECRKLKAFFQLTRDSEFAYALWGVINLNMSLPLSYVSLCTTYLVIIIQFSKFID